MGARDVIRADVAVVGAGAAGLYAAVKAAAEGARVALVSATPLAESASYWAQGGLAAALGAEDSPAAHLDDTVRAGRGAVRRSVAEAFCAEAPAAVADLVELGVSFDSDRHGALALGLEGGHSARRVVHAGGSATGRRVTRELSALVAADERIEVLEGRRAVGLLTQDGRSLGLECEDRTRIGARGVILATGGAAALWSRTTNPAGATGGGLLLARAAGAALADLELVQFHPTAVAGLGAADGFLVTEAVRGEGGVLLDGAGERFVDELAPRDEVAKAIRTRLRESGASAVALDMREVDLALFPNVVAVLREAGLDPARETVPVAPAAHYVMGGIATDAQGRSSLPGLLAVGECACTGLHGANRLASNSLSACFVFGARAARAALAEPEAPAGDPPSAAPRSPSSPPSAASRAAVWRDAGPERDAAGLTALLEDPHELVRLVAGSALTRQESRGAHQRTDFPETDAARDEGHVVVHTAGDPAWERWT
ncbi:MAG: L-aspartate oxidase [Solirubrobacteraceae bacterium]